MAVADNKTYKNMYHFNDNFYGNTKIKETPSVNVDPKINDTIKKNPYKSNVEVEKDELVLQPDLSAIFKVKGKTHAQGGTPVQLKPDSFIFSNDKSVGFNKDDCEDFEFKTGGTYTKNKKYTPAEVLKKNIDTEHYNTLTANIQDPKKDFIAKQSSELMLQKYIQTLGNIAFLQESKKDFPDGVPAFAQNTAPVYDTELKDDIMQQKQYAKYGGRILPRAQMGMWYAAKYGTPQVTPTSPKQGKYSGVPAENPYSGVPQLTQPNTSEPPCVGGVFSFPQNKWICPQDNVVNPPAPQVNQVSGETSGIKRADWQFTPWQKISLGYNASRYATAQREMPYRSQIDPTYVNPYLQNPEQAVSDAKGQMNQYVSSLGTLSPILRNTQGSTAYGQYLDKTPEIRGQYDNQNAQIMNQSRQYNNQIRNNAEAQNKQLDQQYYQQSVTGRQNFNNLRGYLSDQFMNELTGDASTNEALSLGLLSQNNPAYNYDFKHGNFTRTNKSILDVPTDSKSDFYTQVANNIYTKMSRGEKPTKEEVDFFKALSLGKIPFSPSSQKKGGRFNPYKN